MAAGHRRLTLGAALALPGPALLVLLLLLPLWSSTYIHSFMIDLMTYAVLAQSWNLFSGYTGYLSLGHGVFFGVGVYAFALGISKGGWPPPLALAAGGTLAVLLAAAFGSLFLWVRIKIAYFALLTLGLSEIVRAIIQNTPALGGAQGTTTPMLPTPLVAYYFQLFLTVAVTLVAYLVRRSRLGLGLRAIHADELAAMASGVHAFRHKFLVLLLSALFPGLAGAMTVWFWSYTEPDQAFNLIVSFNMVIMSFFGGVGTVAGPLVGASAMGVVSELLSTRFPFLHGTLFGLLVILIIIFWPGGVLQVAGRFRAAFSGAGGSRPAGGPAPEKPIP
jgi:branched-chain amino acid transport system permease protein